MSEVKFYKARYIIIWHENQHKTLENGYLGVRDDKIEGFYTRLPEGALCEDLGDVAITPGFINLHTHPSEVFCLKSYREDIGNPNFYEGTLYDYALVLPFTQRSGYLQAKLNIAEILKSGCTTQLIYGGGYSRVEAEIAGEMGARAYVGAAIRAGDPMEERSIWESPDGHSIVYNFNEEAGMERLAEAVDLVKEMKGAYDGRINAILAPTQTMTCTPKMLKETRKWADKLGGPITIHGSEAPTEFESCIRMFGQTPVEFMNENGMLGEDTIIAHCLYIAGHSHIYMAGNRDLKLLGDTKSTVAHCPWALARAGNTLQSFARYKKAGVNLGIGTDTFSSDFIQEMRFAASLGKVVDRSTFAVGAKDIFDAATIGGAKALDRKDLGRLEAGAKADFVVFKLDSIEMAPVRDVVKNIIYSATRHSVRDVYVDGACVVKDGAIAGFDESALAKELQALTEEVWRNTGKYDRLGRGVDELSPLAAPTYTG
ncbi:amidohydrolase family protein [Ruminococcaceae bacterium OttesenSCG-928-D13]|nr:amidohydrolase family protein [Ruminococcaceae bacterium OttesenSCG-928-D13]